MLLSFSVANFRSFRDEQTLNLLASKRLGDSDKSPHCREVADTGEHALRIASLYGANGAGKSNLVQALFLLKQLVLHGTPVGESIQCKPFLLDDESPTKPSFFELRFLEKGQVFSYGICYDSQHIHEERLYVYEKKKERNLFTRVGGEDGFVTVNLGSAAKGASHSRKLKSLAEVGARPNQLFLTEIINLDDKEAQGPCFQHAISWFSSTLTIIGPNATFASLAQKIASDKSFAEFAGDFLREASTGIADFKVDTSEIPRSKSSADSADVMENLFRHFPEGHEMAFPGPDGEELFVDGTSKDMVKVRKIATLHDVTEGQQKRLSLSDESDGSRRLLHLLPTLYSLAKQGGVFVIDELERSMHPMLARKFIEFFLKAAPNANSQLIFTTHESNLLDLDLMRRDGIWFAEKDRAGATSLYSLADFKVRNDLKIDKGYLAGRFGAIPFLGGIDHLIEERVAEGAST